MLLLLLTLLQSCLFTPDEVTLQDDLFLVRQNKNTETLMQWDVDRLLTPFIVTSGLDSINGIAVSDWEKEHPAFRNWAEENFRLDGHVTGHYLSALSLAYSVRKDEKIKERIDYMVDILAECQDEHGYIGALPDKQMWEDVHLNNLERWNDNRANVPIYTIHKVMAGLRDAYVYAGNMNAFDAFLKTCDWAIWLIEKLDERTVQYILDTEHGGINEVLADAYTLSGNEDYLRAAYRYCHKIMVDGQKQPDSLFLDNKHANTQVPKYIGFARIAQENKDSEYIEVARNFWNDVVENRTVCIGGNSMGEHFISSDQGERYITDPNGPETCNTYNMLHLSEILWSNSHDAQYAQFYENALYNHILSSIDPVTGGYVYHTPLRPGAYRVYSTINESMWCCVGTGMENHSKYAEFIYAHDSDTLFVNLFINSELKSEKFNVKITNNNTLTITKSGHYTLAVRHGDKYEYTEKDWTEGDTIALPVDTTIHYEPCPNYPDYVAIKRGPVLLAQKVEAQKDDNYYGHEGRFDQLPSNHKQIDTELYNKLSDVNIDDLVPFYDLHSSRYNIYFLDVTAEKYDSLKTAIAQKEAERKALDDRTIDIIHTGEQQSDADHRLTGQFEKGIWMNEHFVHCFPGQSFTYTLRSAGATKLCVRYFGGDERRFTIKSGDIIIAEVNQVARGPQFYNVEYDLPAKLLKQKELTITFDATHDTFAGGIYEIRLLK